MSLTDVMSGAGLHLYAEIGLLVFGAAFVWVCVHAFRRKHREEFERARFLPLDEDGGAGGRSAPPEKGTER